MQTIYAVLVMLLIFTNTVFTQSTHSLHKQLYGSSQTVPKNVETFQDFQSPSLKNPKELNGVVFGYLPYWEIDNPTLRYDLLTHIALFDFEADSLGKISLPPSFPTSWNSVISQARLNGVKLIMCVTNFDASQINYIISNSQSKTTIKNSIVNLIKQYDLDGVNIDFEGLATADRGTPINTFMTELTTFVHTEVPGSEVSFAAPVINWSGWNLTGLANSCDYLFIMGYDFYGSWSDVAGPSAPLIGDTYNISYALSSNNNYGPLVSSMPEKLILGLPFYGNKWQTKSLTPNDSVVKYSSSLFYRDAYPQSQQYGKLWSSKYSVPYFTYTSSGKYYQAWFDDSLSLGMKFNLAKEKKLRGVGMWALNYDKGYNHLWQIIENRFVLSNEQSEVADANSRNKNLAVASYYGKEETVLKMQSFKDQSATLQLFSITGELLYQQNYEISSGETVVLSLNQKVLSSAVVIYAVTTPTGFLTGKCIIVK